MIHFPDLEKEFLIDEKQLNLDKFKDLTPITVEPFAPKSDFSSRDDNSDLMQYFRAIIEVQEFSYRSLAVSFAVLQEDPTDIVGWWLRQKTATELRISTNYELQFFARMAPFSFKSYQIWNYRFWLQQREDAPELNFDDIKIIIASDERNFHAWSCISKISNYVKNYSKAFDLTTYFIQKNYKNSSAWTLRAELLEHLKIDSIVELEFAMNQFGQYGGNEAICNYIRFLLQKYPELNTDILIKLDKVLEKNQCDKSTLFLCYNIADRTNDLKKRNEYFNRLKFLDNRKINAWQKFITTKL